MPANPVQMRQLFLGLCTNAFRAHGRHRRAVCKPGRRSLCRYSRCCRGKACKTCAPAVHRPL
jgi:hypothetical protein